MVKFLYVIFMNLFRAPYMIPKMRYQANHPEKYSEKKRYNLVCHAITLMKRTGKICTKSYGEENLPREGGYIMYPNHQGKFSSTIQARPPNTAISRKPGQLSCSAMGPVHPQPRL